MGWYKIVFPEEMEPLHVQNQIVVGQVIPIYLAARDPPGFCVYTELLADTRTVVYFTPIAAERCMDLIKAHHGEPCDKPVPTYRASVWSITWVGGNPDCRDWLK